MPETTASAVSAPGDTVVADSATPRGRRAGLALWGLQVLLALFYVIAGAVPKLIAHESAVESFDELGWGSAGMYTIGLLELAGGIALVVPALVSVAAVSLSALMLGAFITQLAVFDGEYAATPLILIVPLALIAWARRGWTAHLVALARRRS